MHVSFSEKAFAEFTAWQAEDKKIAKKLNKLVHELIRSPYEGTGKPEALKHEYQGFWSRRIDEKNRIVYKVDEENQIVNIIHCKGHYEVR